MATYPGMMKDDAAAVKAFAAVLQGIAQNLGGMTTSYNNAMQMNALTGDTKGAVKQQVVQLFGTALSQMFTGLGQTRSQVSAGAAQLQAIKGQCIAITTAARTQLFWVQPTGVVEVSGVQRAKCAAMSSGGAARLAMYKMRAAAYTGQVNGTVAQATSVDAQIGTAIVKIITDLLTGLLQKKLGIGGAAGTGTAPGLGALPGLGTVPSGTPVTTTPTLPVTTLPGVTTGPFTSALPVTALAGAGGGFEAGVGSALTGVSASGGATAPGVLAGGAAGAGAGVLGVGAAGAAGAAGGARTAMAGGAMMPMAGGHGATGDRRIAAGRGEDWLHEDDVAWKDDDAPDGVVA